MRLIVTLIWCLGAICWLPWAALAVRLAVDLLQGTPWEQSYFVKPVLVALWPKAGLLQPWSITSVWPLAALTGVALSAVGWRIYWVEQQGVLTRPAAVVALSVVIPALAPLVMLADARRRHARREAELDGEVVDARRRLEADGMDRRPDSWSGRG